MSDFLKCFFGDIIINLVVSQSGVHLVRGIVKDVQPEKIILSDGTSVPYGLLVWSTGVGPSSFVKSLDVPKSPGGRSVVNLMPFFQTFCCCIEKLLLSPHE